VVEPGLAELVDDHSRVDSQGSPEQPRNQCRFAAAEKMVMTVTGVRAGLRHRLGILAKGKRGHTIRSACLRDPWLFHPREKVKSKYSMHALAV
jgi:hypothetical protein